MSVVERAPLKSLARACAPAIEAAAATFLDAGLKLIESFAANSAAAKTGSAPADRMGQAISSLITHDARTNRPAFSIPLSESISQERIVGAISALFRILGPSAQSASEPKHRE